MTWRWIIVVVTCTIVSGKYVPTWESLDSRPLPQWYDEAKLGIFIHWGVFSVPSFGSEWFWKNWKSNSSSYVEFMTKNYPPQFTYQDFGPQFTAEFYNPNDWAELFESSGAKYIVLTSKHHEGYTLWPSKYSFSWNSVDVGPLRDLVGDLAKAIRKKPSLKFGLYHSLFEWYNPLYIHDKSSRFTTQRFSTQKSIPELVELVETYKPEVIWSDGDWEASDEYWKSKDFLTWLYNDSPVKDTIVVNDRWGRDIPCKHGDFYTCQDRYNPGVLQTHKWENCMTIDKRSWGYRRNAKLSDYLTTKDILLELASTVSCGGNLLMNIGPTKEGMISPIFEERLRDVGAWLKINGESIYSTKPWKFQNDTTNPNVWYTRAGDNVGDKDVYAIFFDWPSNGILELGAVKTTTSSKVAMLGVDAYLPFQQAADALHVTLPNKTLAPSSWAWVLKMKNLSDGSQW